MSTEGQATGGSLGVFSPTKFWNLGPLKCHFYCSERTILIVIFMFTLFAWLTWTSTQLYFIFRAFFIVFYLSISGYVYLEIQMYHNRCQIKWDLSHLDCILVRIQDFQAKLWEFRLNQIGMVGQSAAFLFSASFVFLILLFYCLALTKASFWWETFLRKLLLRLYNCTE